jgi:LmbE family N-acetylglucosaminyl deacetylase
MPNLFLAPHSDDEALFGSYIIQRSKARVIVVTDGAQHQRKFHVPLQTRRDESIAACKILGTSVRFLGLSDEYDVLTKEMIKKELEAYKNYYGIIFAPVTIKGAHPQHNMVSEVAEEIWGDRVMYYGIYKKDGLNPVSGEMLLNGTLGESTIKREALSCYKSQIKLNEPFFIANNSATEYLSFRREHA